MFSWDKIMLLHFDRTMSYILKEPHVIGHTIQKVSYKAVTTETNSIRDACTTQPRETVFNMRYKRSDIARTRF